MCVFMSIFQDDTVSNNYIGGLRLLGNFKLLTLKLPNISGVWSMLVEVSAALSVADDRVKRQWLLDALEISCVSEYPSTVSILFFRKNKARTLIVAEE